jgi:hypothetical protein
VLFSKKIGLIDDSGNVFEEFTVVDVFPDTDKEHIWNMVTFTGDEA